MRVYLPATLPILREVLAVGAVSPPPMTGYAVTPALREWYAEGDLEELEYAALMEAARESLRLLAADAQAPPRRVVLAADVPDDAVRPVADAGRAAVRVSVAVPLDRVAAAHVDGADDAQAASDIRAAAEAVLAADAGDDDAAFTVDGAEAYELLWFATQELPDLLR
jgi:hypothetical protein